MMKRMKKYTRASILALLCVVFALFLSFSASAIEIDEENPNIERYIMDIEGLHSSISAINTLISGSNRLATFYIKDYNAFLQYVNGLDWSINNDLPQLMGLRSQTIANIKRTYYTNIDNFINLIGAFGQMKYTQSLNTSLNIQIGILEERLTYKDLDIRDLNIIITNLQADNESLLNDKSSLEAQIGSLEAQIGSLEAQIESLNTELGLRYNEGYNNGFNDNKIFLNGLATIFSSPMYVFGEVFDFEFLGFNILTLIQMFLTIMLVAFIFKKVR